MKTFWKAFALAFVCFIIIFSGAILTFNKYMKEDESSNLPVVIEEHGNENLDPEDVDYFMDLVYSSNRINFAVLGLEGARSDMMMFLSFDPDTKSLDGISIPRDTYFVREGYPKSDQKKINAAYGAHGATGIKTVLSSLLQGVPVDYYVTVSYKGVAAVVDSIGGVPVKINQLMAYDDPYDDPPLHIYFEPGSYTLNGADSVKFLRYRKPNQGSGAMDRDGDIGRIQAQQEFIKSAIKKILGPKLPNAVGTAFKHVKTDINLQDAMKLATEAIGLNLENVNMRVMPGVAEYLGGVSYFFHDAEELKDLLIEMYGGVVETVESEASSEPVN